MTVKMFRCDVAGVTFEPNKSQFESLAKTYFREGKPGFFVNLIKEPDNLYDSNAVAVHVDIEREIYKIGYLPKAIAKSIAKSITDSKASEVEVVSESFNTFNGQIKGLGLDIRVTTRDNI